MQINLNLKLTLIISFSGLLSACVSRNNRMSSNTNQDTLEQKYVYYSEDSLGIISLDLGTNGSFEYHMSTDLWHKHSNGKWTIKHDTIVLNSGLQKNHLPVKIKRYRKSDLTGQIHFGWVVNQRGDILKDAQIFFNNNGGVYCMPTLEDCRVPIDSISTLKVMFSENVSSDWIAIKAKQNDSISLIVLADDYLSNYLFFEDDKYVIAGDTLYHLIADMHQPEKNNTTFSQDRSHFLINTNRGNRKK